MKNLLIVIGNPSAGVDTLIKAMQAQQEISIHVEKPVVSIEDKIKELELAMYDEAGHLEIKKRSRKKR